MIAAIKVSEDGSASTILSDVGSIAGRAQARRVPER